MQATAKHERRQRPLSRRYGPITRFGELWLLTPPGVFVPRSDAGMLATYPARVDGNREHV